MRFASALAAAILWVAAAEAAELAADQAAKHVGETATVCGTVASAYHAARVQGEPTFLDFDKPHPNEIFVAVIWGNDRAAFDSPEKRLRGKRVCVTGVVRLHRNRPEIILTRPDQLSIP